MIDNDNDFGCGLGLEIEKLMRMCLEFDFRGLFRMLKGEFKG